MVTVAAIVAAAATVGGVVLSAARGSGGGSTTTSQVEFPEQTRRIIGDIEFPQVQSSLDEQSAWLAPLLGGNAYNPFVNSQFGQRPLASAQGALKRGAKDAGVSNLSGMDNLSALSPQLVEAIRSLAMQNAAQRTSAVPTGFGPFLSPSTLNQQSSDSSPFETGFSLATGVASIGGSFAKGFGGAG